MTTRTQPVSREWREEVAAKTLNLSSVVHQAPISSALKEFDLNPISAHRKRAAKTVH